MHFLKSIVTAAAVLTVEAVAQNPFSLLVNYTASRLDINKLGETPLVSWANSSIWIGGIKSETYSEAFLAQGDSGFTFTSYHSVPTGWQTLYIYPNKTQPISFTVPHSASIPADAATTGFGFGANGYLTYNGENKFIGVQTGNQAEQLQTYQIWWAGGEAPAGYNATGPLYLYKYQQCITA